MLPNVLFAFLPRVVMAAMQTTMIRANITAYSTAVGPSSFFRKRTVFFSSAWHMSFTPPRGARIDLLGRFVVERFRSPDGQDAPPRSLSALGSTADEPWQVSQPGAAGTSPVSSV